MGNEWIDFLFANPDFLEKEPNYAKDLQSLDDLTSEIEDFEIKPNEEAIEEVRLQIAQLEDKLADVQKGIIGIETVLDRFKSLAEKYRKQKEEEEFITRREDLIRDALGTEDRENIPTSGFDKTYEPFAKKAIEFIWRSTVAVMKGKPHQIRANTFGAHYPSFPNREKILGVYITSQNEDMLIPGLMDRLRTNEVGGIDETIDKDGIIAMVMVQKVRGKLVPVGVDGKPLKKGANLLDEAIYQVFPKGEFVWSKEFDEESAFRAGTSKATINAVKQQYQGWRDRILSEVKDLSEVHSIGVSFGFPDYVKLPSEDDTKKAPIDYNAKVSVEDSALVSSDQILEDPLILIPTLDEKVSKGTVTFKSSRFSNIGKIFLNLPNGVTKLHNRKHGETKAKVIHQVLVQLAKQMMDGEIGIHHPKSVRLLTYLKSIVYWGIPSDPTTKERKPKAYNGIFFERDKETGKLMLYISGKGMSYNFTPSALEENKADILLVLEEMYHNVHHKMVGNLDDSYEEIISIRPNGEPEVVRWNNYQSYLLSKTTPDGKTRDNNDLPLFTNIRPVKDENDVNREGIYFYTTDTVDDLVIPEEEEAPVPAKPAVIAPKGKEQERKKYVLDGKTTNIYTSPAGKVIRFKASPNTTRETIDKDITVFQSDDLAGVVKAIEATGKDAKLEIKKVLYNEILPSLKEEQEEGEGITITAAMLKGEKPSVKEEEGEEEEGALTISAEMLGKQTKEDEEILKIKQESTDRVAQHTGKTISDDIANIVKNTHADDEESLREKIEGEIGTKEVENWGEIESWLKKTFPNVPVYRVKNIISTIRGKKAWGMFKDGAIYVYENAEVGTIYHEVFEAVWHIFSSPSERKSVISEFRGRDGYFTERTTGKTIKYTDATDEQVKEQIAEEFRDYKQFKKIPPKPGTGKPFILKLFADLVSFIKHVFYGEARNIEELFERISTGYYSNIIPSQYDAQLSLANKGVIDVEEAFGDEGAHLREIADKTRSEILEHMTYLTLTELIRTDKSLFDVPAINKEDLYKRLKAGVLKAIDSNNTIAAKLVVKKKFTKEQIQSYLDKNTVLMQQVDEDWEDVVKKHEEYLLAYSIEFDENDNLQRTDEDNSGRGEYQESTKIDNFRKAHSAIKLLLATLPKSKIDGETGKVVWDKSGIGGVQLLPVSQVYGTLINNLYSSLNPDKMMEKLREIAKNDINYRALYKRITKSDWAEEGVDYKKINTEHSFRLFTSFYTTFKKQNPATKIVYILENGDVEIGDANLSTVAGQLRNDYVNGVISAAKTGEGYFKYNTSEKQYERRDDEIAKIRLDTPVSMIKFLNRLGVKFDIEDVKKLNSEQTREFEKIVLGIKESVAKMSPVKVFSGKNLNIQGRLFELGALQATVDNPDVDITFFNVEGERVQSYIGTNTISDFSNFISQLDEFNEESLKGTNFDYLRTDSFANNSVILKKMFRKNGTKKSGVEDLLRVGYVSGIYDETRGKKKQSSKLSYMERIVQELNLNLKGWYLNLVPGDANIEWMVYMSNHFTSESLSKGLGDVNEIFKGYFISELTTARDKDRKVVKDRDSKELRFFKDILGKDLHDEIIVSKDDVDEVYKNYEKKINAALSQFIAREVEETRETLEKYNLIVTTDQGMSIKNVNLPKNMSKEALDMELVSLAVNYIINNIEYHKLIYSDPYQYKDELKRIKTFNSPRQSLATDSKAYRATMSRIWNKGFKKKGIGWTNFTRNYFRTTTLEDVMAYNALPKYGVYEETDGGGMIIYNAYRNFRLSVGDWNSDEERQYRYDVAWEKRDKGKEKPDDERYTLTDEERVILGKGNPEIKSAYKSLKPVVAGNKANDRTYNDVVLDKFALYPVSYRIAKEINNAGKQGGSNLVNMYNKMQEEDVDYAVYNTGRKVGAEETHPIYNEDGTFNNTPFTGIINVPLSIISVQSEVPSKDEDVTTRGSQITKMSTMDFMDAGVPIDFDESEKDISKRYIKWNKLSEEEKLKQSDLYKEIKNNQNLLVALIKNGYDSLLKRLGIVETVIESDVVDLDTGKTKKLRRYEIEDYSITASILREEMLKREVNDNVSAAIKGFLNGDTLLEATPAYHQVRNILYSIADKEVVSPKMPGRMSVQITSALMEQTRMEIKNIEGKKGFESPNLAFYTKDIDKDGKTIKVNVCELMISRWFESDMSDADLLKYLNDTPEGQKILSGIAYRIPTQKQNSMEVFKIKQFLPKEFGDNVVVPSALVKKAGSDFDIDKLTIYLKNIFTHSSGELRAVPFLGYGEEAKTKLGEMYDNGEFLTKEQMKELDRFIAEEKDEFFSKVYDEKTGEYIDTPENKLIRTIFAEAFSDETLTREFVKSITKEKVRSRYIDKLYKQGLQNAYITSLENLIAHPRNFERLTQPNSAKQLKALAGFIAKATTGSAFDYKKPGNLIRRSFMSRLRHAFVSGKYAIGIAAVNQTNHSLNQRQLIYIDDKRLSLVDDVDKFWLGDAQIKFEAFNRIKVGDRMVPTLSMIRNAERSEEFPEGQDISDIIAQFIDGYVDISKGPWIMELGATPNVASTFLFLAKIGVPIDTVVYFMNQPIIRDYLRKVESAGYTWLFIDNFYKDMIDAYDSGVKAEELKAERAKFTIPSKKQLRDSVGKKSTSMNKNELLSQQLILGEFLKYAKMANHMFLVSQGSNYDTANFNDPFLVYKKSEQFLKAQKTIISSVDDLLENTFVGELPETMNNINDAYSTILKTNTPRVWNVITKTLKPFVDVRDREFVKIARKAVNDLFDWAVQTDQEFNREIERILMEDGGVAQETMDFVKKVKADTSHPLHGNHVLEIINPDPSRSASKNSVTNIRVKGGENRAFDQNNIIFAFREIRDFLKEDKESLYDRIVLLSILQSGLSPSTISFTSLIPYEDFERIYAKTLMKLEGISNLEDFNTLDVFYRNNWNNSDIIPYKKARKLPDQPGKKGRYNPSMEFLPFNVKNAIDRDEIPRILTQSLYEGEGTDFLVYTWAEKADNFKTRYKGLFKKVTHENGVPFMTTDKQGREYFVYKAVNAWGDGHRANEFYDEDKPSIIDNGFISAIPVDNSRIISIFTAETKYTTVMEKSINGNRTINVYWGQPESATSTRILSNLAPRKFMYESTDGITREYGSVEHAYQSNKNGKFDQTTYNSYISKGGYGVKISPKLTEVGKRGNLQLMKDLVVESFVQNPSSEAAKKLLQYENFTHNTNELIDKAFLEGLKLAQQALLKEDKTLKSSSSTVVLRDGKTYNVSDVSGEMLKKMGYSPIEIGKVLKQICG